MRTLYFLVFAWSIIVSCAGVAWSRDMPSEPLPIPSDLSGYRVVKKVAKARITKYYTAVPGQPRYSRKRNGSSRTYHEEIRLQGGGKETYFGTQPRIGTIAANVRYFKPFSLVRIKEKVGRAFVTIFVGRIEDTGGSMKRNHRHFDLYNGKGYRALIDAEQWNSEDREFLVEVLEKRTS